MKIPKKRPKPALTLPNDGTLRVLVCGSRDWTDEAAIRKHFLKFIYDHGIRDYARVLVITGGADGADTIIERLCLDELGIACARFGAAWKAFGRNYGNPRPAGPVRNRWMLTWGQPNAVLAFHPYLPGSKGTKNMVDQARRSGITRIKVVSK